MGRALLYEMQDRTYAHATAADEARQRVLAAEWGRIAAANGEDYRARYEQACCLSQAHQRAEAEKRFKELYAQALKAGVLPPIDRRFQQGLQNLGEKPIHDQWNPLMHETARQFIDKKRYTAAVALAEQCWQLDERALAGTLLNEVLAAVKNQPDGWMTTLAVVDFYQHNNELARADALLQPLLADPRLAEMPGLWRLAAALVERRGMETQAISYLEKALGLEYRHLPNVIDLNSWRADYGRLLNYYLKSARGAKALNAAAPPDLRAKTLRTIDRWRAHDPEANERCKTAAEIFNLLGETELAWDYHTTALLDQGLSVSTWQNLAESLSKEGDYRPVADEALLVAAQVEPSNAEVLWQRALNLRAAKQNEEADQLLRRLANETWPERYQGIRAAAQFQMKGR